MDSPLSLIKSSLRGVLVLGVLAASLAFTGCASVPRIEPDKAALKSVRTIALLRVQEPRTVEVANLGGAASAFGLIGGIAQGVNNMNRTEEFVTALRESKRSLAEPFSAKLVESLQAAGYHVTVSEQQPKPAAENKSDDFSTISVKEDLILCVWIGHTGYFSQPYSLSFEPCVLISARALDARTKRDLYWKTFSIGYDMKIKQVTNIPADPRYTYASHPEIMKQIDDSITGLIESHNLAARAIAADLRP